MRIILTEDFKKKRSSNESFWLVGQPDVVLRNSKVNQTRRGRQRRRVYEVEVSAVSTTSNIVMGSDRIGWSRYRSLSVIGSIPITTASAFPATSLFPLAGEREKAGEAGAEPQSRNRRRFDRDVPGTSSSPFPLGNTSASPSRSWTISLSSRRSFRRCALRQRWKQDLAIMFGASTS